MADANNQEIIWKDQNKQHPDNHFLFEDGDYKLETMASYIDKYYDWNWRVKFQGSIFSKGISPKELAMKLAEASMAWHKEVTGQ